MPTITLLGYNIFSGKKDFLSKGFKGIINTINPHSYIIACKDNYFHDALTASDIIIPDDVGFIMAAFVLAGKKIKYPVLTFMRGSLIISMKLIAHAFTWGLLITH